MPRQPFYPYRSEQAKTEFEAHCREWARKWPVPSETRVLDTPSGRTFVRASGRDADPPLILLPGVRFGSLMWMSMVAALSAHHRTYAVDIIGDVGFSVSRSKVSTYEDLARWVNEVVSELVPEGPVSLMGVSYGGAISAQYALRFPGRVAKVVLVAPGATVLKSSFGFFARMMLLCIPRPGVDGNALRRMFFWLFEDAARGDEASRTQLEQALAHAQLAVRSFALPIPPWPKVLTDEEWEGFAVPGLFLVGEHEKIYAAEAAVRRLNRVAPQVKTEIIRGAGHDVTMVHPDLVTRKALDFLGG